MKFGENQDQPLRSKKLDFGSVTLKCKEFYPQQLLFEMNVSKDLLKKNAGLQKI